MTRKEDLGDTVKSYQRIRVPKKGSTKETKSSRVTFHDPC